MEPPPGAVLRDGWWSWQPDRALRELVVTASTHVRDYRLCDNGACRELRSLIGAVDEGAAVTIRPCRAALP